MGKIQITESELKQIIRESVEEVLKEGIGADFDNLQKGIGKNLLGAAAQSILPGFGYHIGVNQLVKAYDKGKGFVNNIRKRYNDYDNQVNQNQTLQQQVTDFGKQINSYKDALAQLQNALSGPLKESVNEDEQQAAETDVLANVPQMVQQIQNMRTKAQLVPGLQNKVKQLTAANQQLTAQLQQPQANATTAQPATQQRPAAPQLARVNNKATMTPGTAQA